MPDESVTADPTAPAAVVSPRPVLSDLAAYPTLGALMTALRNGASVIDVAADVGVARSYIYQIEAGERNPSASVLGRLLTQYGAFADEKSRAWDLLSTAPPLHS
jgi:hypothetical protein